MINQFFLDAGTERVAAAVTTNSAAYYSQQQSKPTSPGGGDYYLSLSGGGAASSSLPVSSPDSTLRMILDGLEKLGFQLVTTSSYNNNKQVFT